MKICVFSDWKGQAKLLTPPPPHLEAVAPTLFCVEGQHSHMSNAQGVFWTQSFWARNQDYTQMLQLPLGEI